MINKRTALFVMLGIIWLSLSTPLMAEGIEAAPEITDREIIESLVAIRGDIKRIDQRFVDTMGRTAGNRGNRDSECAKSNA